jgi:hypothetical protein
LRLHLKQRSRAGIRYQLGRINLLGVHCHHPPIDLSGSDGRECREERGESYSVLKWCVDVVKTERLSV